jgi:hypothetical protein
MDPTSERVQPQAFEDGLGRRYTVDAGGESLEVLTVRTELAAAPSFEFALRERATRLGGFLRACYAPIRSVERVEADAPALAVVSERTEGTRLSRILDIAEQQQIPLDIDAGLCLIRQAAQALSLLHEHVPDVAHGALAPERLIVTPHARLVVTDYVFGAALAELSLSRDSYWKELRVALPAGAGAPRLDRRTDVTQLGVVAMAAILGRPIRDDEYPARIAELAAGAEAVTPTGREPLSSGLRAWLSRALQLDPHDSFASAVDAGAALEQVLGDSDYTAAPAALQAFLSRCLSAASQVPVARYDAFRALAAGGPEGPPLHAAAPPAPAPPAREPEAPATVAIPLPGSQPAPEAHPAAVAQTTTPEKPGPRADPPAAARSGEFWQPSPAPAAVEIAPAAVPLPARQSWSRTWLVGAAVALIAMTSGVTLGTRYLFSADDSEKPGTLTVTTSTEGVLVVVDGYSRGRTPLTTSLAPGQHTVELVLGSERRKIPVTMVPGGSVSQFVEVAAAPANTGKVHVRTDPPGARVSVDGNYFGSSPITVDGLAPGVHTVRVGDDRDAVTERVTVEAGATAAVVVPLRASAGPSAGWISVNAPAEVELFENGTLIGTSRSSRIMVPPGRHQIELVNESLGYRSTHGLQVAAGREASIRPTWPRGTVALNALPWAEVRIDGERVGETPIGSLSLPIGPHDVVFRHPELGERRHQIVVTLKEPARLSVDMRKK